MPKSISLESLFRELNSFVPCSNYFEAAASSKVTSENSRDFKSLTQGWLSGLYDEDPEYLVQAMVRILEKSAK